MMHCQQQMVFLLAFASAALLLLPVVDAQTIGRVVGLQLVRGGAGAFVTTLANNTLFYLNATLPDYTILAVTSGSTTGASVRFGWNSNSNYRIEREAPYVLCGDSPDFARCSNLVGGTHKITATLFTSTSSGIPYTLTFRMLSGSPPRVVKTPAVNAPTVKAPTKVPTKAPTKRPTRPPTKRPTKVPTKAPTKRPTRPPTKRPTKVPTRSPTKRPTRPPTKAPVKGLTRAPVKAPTKAPKVPTSAPTKTPVTGAPVTKEPTVTTKTPLTGAPVTKAPATKEPTVTTKTPLTDAPATKVPVTKAPVTKEPTSTTKTPVMGAPVTKAPMTKEPTVANNPTLTLVPVTKAPETKEPTVANNTVTLAPVTKEPIVAINATLTLAPVTKAPRTKAPTVTTSTTLAPASTFPSILINCGGPAYTDTLGRLWLADKYFSGGFPYVDGNANVINSDDDPLYNCERYGHSTYAIPVPDGSYTVTLHFAEIYHRENNKRIFDISVEGRFIPDVDIVKLGGGVAFKAITRVIPSVLVTDGFVTIQFLDNIPVIDYPKISAIEISHAGAIVPTIAPLAVPTVAPLALPPAGFQPILINCGGDSHTDVIQNKVWRADAFFTGGQTFATNAPILGTPDYEIFHTTRWGQIRYDVPVPPGLYEVVVHFAEIYFTTVGSRVFAVSVEGKMIPHVDIVALGGGVAFTAVNKTVTASVTDGFLTVQLLDNVPLINFPSIAGMEIHRLGDIAPTTAPIPAPPTADPPTPTFSNIFISCGGAEYTDTQGRVWLADKYFEGGNTYFNGANDILATADDVLYQGERWGEFWYQIPISFAGDYEAVLHFAEIYHTVKGSRVFDVIIEGKEISDLDIIQQAGGPNKAVTREMPVTVLDGFLSIQFKINEPQINDPKVSAIEVRRVGPHYSHAVTGGPYTTVDTDGNGVEAVRVDGSESHTHGPGQVLSTFTWKKGAVVLGIGEVATLNLPVGRHDVTLTVVDSSGDLNIDVTTITVKPNGFPETLSVFPNAGDMAGGTNVTITGLAFSANAEVRFGLVVLRGFEVTVVDATTIMVLSPVAAFGVPVSVSVITPVGESNTVTFTYVNSSPIAFTIEKIMDITNPTAVAFGPDGKLYVGSTNGRLGRFTLNDSYDAVVNSIVTTIDQNRGIHGIAFDPLETAKMGTEISCYISTSDIFHGEYRNSFANAINGKIQVVKGANLDVLIDVVTGLPVSELDHSVNGIYFGDNGELYITIGSNTNGGIPGELSGSRLMRENYFSAAVIVANLGRPGFNGAITYSSQIDGTPISGYGPNGVEVFASGLRNPYGVIQHSNGKVYATDNGPNPGFGDMATGCGIGQQIPDEYEKDELNLLKRGGFYGHPNHKRAETDPRQCTWRAASLPSSDGYTEPLMKLDSSTDGIIEFESDHFNGQLRGDLILSKYTDGLYRVILSSDGESVHPSSNPAIALDGDNGLAVTQAPDGSLVDARYTANGCFIFKPKEAVSTEMDIKSVFPRRGGLAGGSKLMIFGVNFNGSPAVTIGDNICANAVLVSTTKIECTLPGGSVGGKDVVVTIGNTSDNFAKGYRYITGLPA